jgi:uncharacterized protein (TIGR00730 family)
MKRICVFGGANPGAQPVYLEAARNLGATLARQGLGLVYGGGRLGLMGAVANGALEARGEVIGVIPQALAERGLAHAGLTDLRRMASMHERKALMVSLSDAFIALPGGFGTLEEFLEVLTWAQLGLHFKPCGLLNVQGFYEPLLSLFSHTVTEQFVEPGHQALALVDPTPEGLLNQIAAYRTEVIRQGGWKERGALSRPSLAPLIRPVKAEVAVLWEVV